VRVVALGPADVHHYPGVLRAVPHGVLDQVADRDDELLPAAVDDDTPLTRPEQVDALGLRVDPAAVEGRLDHRVETDRGRLLDRVVGLDAGELDDLLDEAGQPLALDLHASGEALHRVGVVRRVLDGFGEQGEGTDRGLELVAHVGDEVAPDRVEAAFLGAVLDEDENQLGSDRRHPGGDGDDILPEPPTRDFQVALADLAIAAHLADESQQLVDDDV
jgi:hypothetical protein